MKADRETVFWHCRIDKRVREGAVGGLFLSCSGDQGGYKKDSRGGEFSLKTIGLYNVQCTVYRLTFILDYTLQTIFHLCIPIKDLAKPHF